MSRMTATPGKTHPEAIGGRIFRPRIRALAFEVFDRMGIYIFQPLDPAFNQDHRDMLAMLFEISRRGKPAERARTATKAAVEAAEAVFAPDTRDDTQCPSGITAEQEA